MATSIVYVIIVVIVLIMFGVIAMTISWLKKPTTGQALIRTGSGGVLVSIDQAMFVVPTLHRLEVIDLTHRIMDVELSGRDSLICKNGKKVDIKVTFHLRINPNPMDITKVAQTLGAEKASNLDYLKTLFSGKFREAIIIVGANKTFEEIYQNIEPFKLELLQLVGMDLNGFVLDDCTVEYIRKID